MNRQPRLTDSERAAIRAVILRCEDQAQADRIINRLWAKLEGDMQDRIGNLINAAQATVGSNGEKTAGLRAALDYLAGREVPATSDEQLREGPWHGH